SAPARARRGVRPHTRHAPPACRRPSRSRSTRTGGRRTGDGRRGAGRRRSPRAATWRQQEAPSSRTRRRTPSLPLPVAVEVEHREERLLRHLDAAYLLHTLLALLLLLEELPLAGDVTAVALCENVLSLRLDGFAGDHARADGGLDRNVEHLARD